MTIEVSMVCGEVSSHGAVIDASVAVAGVKEV